MKTLPATFAARLASGVTTLCLCWRLRRADGLVLGVTDHDRALIFDGVSYAPGGAFEAAEFTSTDDLRPGRADASGALSADAITDADLRAGLWDRARVDVYKVDWTDPSLNVLMWSGFFSEITERQGAFEAELVSLKAELERPVGRVYGRGCDAALGDARCGVDLSEPAYAGLICDQRFETCQAVFSNTDNFRGFPHMPGPDFILTGPAADGNDGGKR